jgi:esterase
MVAIHGLMGNLTHLRGTSARGPVRKETNSYLVELRNHAASEHKDTMTMEDLVEDVAYFIESHKIHKPIILGHSLGGLIAMQLALRYPNLVSSLVVEDIFPVNYMKLPYEHSKDAWEVYDQYRQLRAIDLSSKKSWEEVKKDICRVIKDERRAPFILNNIRFDEDTRTFSWKINLPAIVRYFDHLLSTPFRGVYNGPVHFIVGGKSGFVNKKVTQQALPIIKRLFPSFEAEENIDVIEDAGHWVHTEKPKEFTEALAKFLRQLPEVHNAPLPKVYMSAAASNSSC